MYGTQTRNPVGKGSYRGWIRSIGIEHLLLVFLVGVPTLLAANPLPDKPHIYVQGHADIEVEPDRLIISVGLSETGDELEVAKAEVDSRSQLLIQRALELGIARRDIGTTSVRISPSYDYIDGRRVDLGTSVYRQVTLTLRELTRYSELMSALIEADISSWISTRFLVSNDDALTDEALAQALANARERAEVLAESQGKRLGDIYSISEFDTRREESYRLYPSSRVVGQASRTYADVQVSSAPRSDPFEPGLMVATATVYVVYFVR